MGMLQTGNMARQPHTGSGRATFARRASALTWLVRSMMILCAAGCPKPMVQESIVKVSIGAPSVIDTLAGPVTYPVTYANAAEISLYPDDVTLATSGSVTGRVSVHGLGTSARNVTISNIRGNGSASIALAAGTASDASGNPAPGAVASKTFHAHGVLEPGNGFLAPTPQPPAIGSGAGSDAKAIARWDVVPYQTFEGIFEIGVVAFHINGIDRVEFSLDGGPWTAVKEMTLNPRTNVVEYWTALDASRSPDGPVEVRAIAYPKTGVPRVLGDPIDISIASEPDEDLTWIRGNFAMRLFSNKGGLFSHTPLYVSPNGSDETGDGSFSQPYATTEFAVTKVFQTGQFNGANIYLLEGTHNTLSFGSFPDVEMDTWLTISAAPGLPRDQVLFVDAPGRTNMRLVHIKGVTFLSPSGSDGRWFYGTLATGSKYIWVDGCRIAGQARTNKWLHANQMTADFFTDVLFENNVDGPSTLSLARNVQVRHIGADSFTQSNLVLNCSVEDVDKHASGVPEAHPDIYQVYDPDGYLENTIVYGLSAVKGIKSQGFFSSSPFLRDIAFVNVSIRQVPNTSNHCFAIPYASNLYVSNCTFEGHSHISDTGSECKNVVLENSRFGVSLERAPAGADGEGVTVR